MKNSLADLIGEGYKLPQEALETPQYKIYCDMDGVLTDFQSRFKHFAGKSPDEYQEQYGPAKFWSLIDQKVGLRFWSEMDWMPQGQQLWDFIKPYNPTLLTSPSRDNTSRLGKNTWIRNHISPPPKVIFAYSKDKQRYAEPNAILIDDKKSNIAEWQEAGGIAIRCKDGDVQAVLQELVQLGY